MGAFDDVAAKLKSEIEQVPGIGLVHARPVWTVQWTDFLARLTKDGVINGWWITRERISQTAISIGAKATFRRTHVFVVVGFLSHDDAAGSESMFQDLVEGIFDRLQPPLQLISGRFGFILEDAPTVRSLTTNMVADRLVHYTEIEVPVVTRHVVT